MLFNSWIDITTVKTYIEVGKQLMCYIFWSKDIEPDKRLVYESTERQQMYIEDVQTSIEELVEWKEEQVGDLGSMGEGDEEGESDEEIEWMDWIQWKILWLLYDDQTIRKAESRFSLQYYNCYRDISQNSSL